MKWCVSLRHVFSVLSMVLLNIRTGWMRPASSEVSGYSPPLNCSTSPDWNSPSRPREPPEDLDPDSSDLQDVEQDNSSTSPPPFAHNYLHASPSQSVPDFYLSDKGPEYFDYYYQDFTDSGAAEEAASVRDEQSAQYQQPPPGLNRVAKLKLMKTPRRQPPEYMLELYDRFSRMRPVLTTRSPRQREEEEEVEVEVEADIVRSFPNINKEDSAEVPPGAEDEAVSSEDPQLEGGDTRHHTLVFNITSVLTGEQVSRAELRLYTLVEQDRNTYVGEDRVVRVYEGLKNYHLPPVASRHVYGHSGGWEAFDVTSVVQSWVLKGSRTGDGVQVLDVKIDSLFQSEVKGSGTSMDIDVDPEHNEGPLLVVFSKDTTFHLRQEVQDFINHEQVQDHHDDEEDEEDEDDDDVLESLPPPTTRSEQAEVDSVTSSERTPSTAAGGGKVSLPVTAVSRKPDEEPLRRVRRDKRKRNSCRRKTMYVDFEDINWHQWIIAPHGYMAFECVGKCYVPIGAHLSPTKHAIIQTLVHAAHPKRVSRACCVPTKLEPISILYLDENNIITYKYHYDDMVVAECGCR